MDRARSIRGLKFSKTVLIAALFACAIPGRASLIGTTVNGGMAFFPRDNEFDPSEIGSGITAVIGASSPTFLASKLNVSFAPYRAGGTAAAFQLTFEDSAFVGVALSLMSYGGPFSSTNDFAYSLVGDTISINFAGLPVTGTNDPYTVSFSLAPAPEPSPIVPVLTRLVGRTSHYPTLWGTSLLSIQGKPTIYLRIFSSKNFRLGRLERL
jgi:hypothetical protein